MKFVDYVIIKKLGTGQNLRPRHVMGLGVHVKLDTFRIKTGECLHNIQNLNLLNYYKSELPILIFSININTTDIF